MDDVEENNFGSKPDNGCWKRRSSTERALVVLSLLLFVFVIILLIVSVISNEKFLSTEKKLNLICRTKECVQAASEILENVDSSAKPCDDFYQFVCGNFMKKNVVPDDYLKTFIVGFMQEDILIDLRKLIEPPVSPEDTDITTKTKNLYASCMSSSVEDSSVEALRQLLFRVGGWPVIDIDWNQEDLNLERRLAIVYAHDIEPFLHTEVYEYERNSSDYVFQFLTGSLVLKESFYLNERNPDYIKYIESYKNMVMSTARLLEADESTIQKDVENMMRFEKEYAQISDEEEKRMRAGTETEEKVYTVSELERFMPMIKWGNFFDYIFDYFKLTAQKEKLNIRFQNSEFARKLMFLVKKTTPRTLANYLTWRLVYKLMPYLNMNFRRLYYDFVKIVPLKVVPGKPIVQMFFSRWKECIMTVAFSFPMPLTSLYAKDNFDTVKKNEVVRLISSVKEGFIDGIYKLKWLDRDAKKQREKKVQKMRPRIAFPRYALNQYQQSKDFAELEISNDRFLDNMLKISRHNKKAELALLTGKEKRERDWIQFPLFINAYYNGRLNTINFPVALLRSPILVPQRPGFINYGKLGSFIGHEIGHGFDTHGSSIDADGEYENWRKKNFGEKFGELVNCFAEQYSKLPIDLLNATVDGNQTINDNIADNAGVKSAYRAYNMYISKHGEEPTIPGVPYTNSQLFFISYGQVWCELLTEKGSERYFVDQHSPGRHRTNVPLMNTPEFSEAFNCPIGSYMNPKKKCNMWG